MLDRVYKNSIIKITGYPLKIFVSATLATLLLNH